MDVKRALEERRGFRSLAPAVVDDTLIEMLAGAARLAPSCFNNQPWRYVFVHDADQLLRLRTAISKGNEWTYEASLIVAVCSAPVYDCQQKDGRQYYQFDTGLATGFMLLRAVELGLVAHPIAGFDARMVKELLRAPDDVEVLALVIIANHATRVNPLLSPQQIESEKTRPPRLALAQFAYHNYYDIVNDPKRTVK